MIFIIAVLLITTPCFAAPPPGADLDGHLHGWFVYAISYLSTGRDLLRSAPDMADARDIVIIANPDFDFDAAEPTRSAASQLSEEGEFEPLPETCDEAMEIASLFENPRVVTRAEATTQYLREVRQPTILHIATHGIFSEIMTQETRWRTDWIAVGNTFGMVQARSQVEIANPMFCSGIVLAGANHPGRGVLAAQEVASLDLRGTALVVLSACETGLGRVKAGTEFAGLRRALAIAGSQTQVTSLWKVDNDATRFLMAEYYQLLATGIGRADALEIAQTRLVDAHPEWQHPVFWAAFISAGDFGPVAHFARRRADTAGHRSEVHGGQGGHEQ
jgi:CHAT domain-containing protein